jgi:hypothetical protein
MFCLAPGRQLHLSFTGNPSEMTITWTTLLATSTSTVQWGLTSQVGPNPTSFPNSATGSNRTYTWSGWIGQIHEATMTGLVPGMNYSYRVGDAAGGWSDVFTFKTLDTDAGSPQNPLRILQIGDMGYGPTSNDTVATMTAMVQAGQVDFVLHVGAFCFSLPAQLAALGVCVSQCGGARVCFLQVTSGTQTATAFTGTCS